MEAIQLGNKDYQSLYNLRQAYRRAGGHSDTYAGNFNRFDNPNTYFFRIFFDFHKGLLDYEHDLGKVNKPEYGSIWDRSTYIANSALNYLMLNNEWERADMLREFIHLISNINTYSPWYFTEIEGLGEVIQSGCFNTGADYGSPELAEVLKTRDFKYALCGHVHSGQHLPVELDGKKLVNVSLKNEDYKEMYYPFEFEI